MTNLGDFIRERLDKPRLPAPGTNATQSAAVVGAVAILAEQLPNDQSNEIATRLEKITKSEEFAGEINDSIAPPSPSESEDEFVDRAMSQFKELLLKELR